MGQIVVVNSGTARDAEAFKFLAEKAIALVESELPGTERYELFFDDETSRFVWHEEYADGAAIQAHMQALVGSGVMEDLPELVDFDFVVALGDPEDPEAQAAMEQIGFKFYSEHARAAR